MSRLPTLSIEEMSAEQIEVRNSIISGTRGMMGGPFNPLLYSPELTRRVEQLGVFVRYQCSIPERQRELAICVIAAHWHADFEWYIHAPLTLKQGVSESILKSIGKGETPSFNDSTDATVHAFTTELIRTGHVSDDTYRTTVAIFGEKGTVDLTGLLGYYTLLAMTLNAFEVEVPENIVIPWADEL